MSSVKYSRFHREICCSLRFNSLRFNPLRFNPLRFNSLRFNSLRFNSLRFNSLRFNSLRFNSLPIKLALFALGTFLALPGLSFAKPVTLQCTSDAVVIDGFDQDRVVENGKGNSLYSIFAGASRQNAILLRFAPDGDTSIQPGLAGRLYLYRASNSRYDKSEFSVYALKRGAAADRIDWKDHSVTWATAPGLVEAGRDEKSWMLLQEKIPFLSGDGKGKSYYAVSIPFLNEVLQPDQSVTLLVVAKPFQPRVSFASREHRVLDPPQLLVNLPNGKMLSEAVEVKTGMIETGGGESIFHCVIESTLQAPLRRMDLVATLKEPSATGLSETGLSNRPELEAKTRKSIRFVIRELPFGKSRLSIKAEEEFTGLATWTLDDPILHKATVSIRRGTNAYSELDVPILRRSIEIDRGQAQLNGENIFPRVMRLEKSDELSKAMCLRMQDLGINTITFSDPTEAGPMGRPDIASDLGRIPEISKAGFLPSTVFGEAIESPTPLANLFDAEIPDSGLAFIEIPASKPGDDANALRRNIEQLRILAPQNPLNPDEQARFATIVSVKDMDARFTREAIELSMQPVLTKFDLAQRDVYPGATCLGDLLILNELDLGKDLAPSTLTIAVMDPDVNLLVRKDVDTPEIKSGAGWHEPVNFDLPDNIRAGQFRIVCHLTQGDETVSRNHSFITVHPRDMTVVKPVYVYDPNSSGVLQALTRTGLRAQAVSDLADIPAQGIFVLGAHGWDENLRRQRAILADWLATGGTFVARLPQQKSFQPELDFIGHPFRLLPNDPDPTIIRVEASKTDIGRIKVDQMIQDIRSDAERPTALRSIASLSDRGHMAIASLPYEKGRLILCGARLEEKWGIDPFVDRLFADMLRQP